MDDIPDTPHSTISRFLTSRGPFQWGCFVGLFGFFITALGLVLPEHLKIPVHGAIPADWNHQTFWHHPWGKSVVHKGIDIFATEGTPVLSATSGWVLSTKSLPRGGNVVLILGPKWRLHYYAHLKTISVDTGSVVRNGESIGTVGTSGNARGTPAHLHYSIVSLVPYPWRIDSSPQGWKKMFFLDPSQKLLNSSVTN